jgi:hypothetical protein
MNLKAFVNAWVEAYNKKQGVPSVAQRMDISIEKASAKANYLRKKGVHLPPMPRTRAVDNTIEQLNQLIDAKVEQRA